MRNLKKFLALALAVMMVFSLFVTVNAATPAFTDAAEASTVYQDALKALSAVGAMKGYDDGSVDPAKPIARKEFAAMLYRLLTGDVAEEEAGQYAQYAAVFTDVGTNKWYSGPVGYLYHNNIMVGMSDTEFGKDENVKAEHVIIALLRAVGLVVNDKELTDENPSGLSWGLVVNMAMNRATTYKLNAGVATKELSGAVTREVVAQLIFNAFTSPKYYPDPYATRPDNFVATKDTLGAAVGLVEDDSVPASAKNDPYGRPDATKVIPIGEDDYIITEREATLIATFDSEMKAGEAVTALKAKSVTQFAQGAKVYMNGSTNVDSNVAGYIAGGKGLGGEAIDVKFMNNLKVDGKTRPWSNKGVIDYLTSSDNTVVEVYATEIKNDKKEGTGKYEITQIVSINTFVSDPLTKSQIVAAKGTTKAGIMLEGKKFETTDAYEVGDVVLYTKGHKEADFNKDIVIMSAKKADSFEGKLESVTTKDNVTTYTIDGVGYTASDAVGGSITTDKLAGKDCVFYYLTDNDTKYLVYAKLKPAEDGEEEVAEKGYIYITANAAGTLVEDNSGFFEATGNGVYVSRVYGVLADGSHDAADYYYAITPGNDDKGWGANDKEKAGLYPYEMDKDTGYLKLGDKVDTKLDKAAVKAGAIEITLANKTTPTLNSETVFLFVTMKDDKKEIDKLTVKTGTKNIGGGITEDDSENTIVAVNKDGIAEVVVVPAKYEDKEAGASGDYVLIDILDYTETTTGTGDNDTTFTYTGYTADGEEKEIVVKKAALDGTGYKVMAADGKTPVEHWVVFELKDDGSVGTTAITADAEKGPKAEYGKLITKAQGSVLTFQTTKATVSADSDGVSVCYFGDDDELKLGQTVVYLYEDGKEGAPAKLVAVWVMEDADVMEATATVDKAVTEAGYTVEINPKVTGMTASPEGTTTIHNEFTITVTAKEAVDKETTLKVTVALKGQNADGSWGNDKEGKITDQEGTFYVTVKIGAKEKTGTGRMWISTDCPIQVTVKEVKAQD